VVVSEVFPILFYVLKTKTFFKTQK
jgi:hypothetical protein